jgi:hypothetical protein
MRSSLPNYLEFAWSGWLIFGARCVKYSMMRSIFKWWRIALAGMGFLVGAVFAHPVAAADLLNTKPAGSIVIIESETLPVAYKFMKVAAPGPGASLIWEMCWGATGSVCTNNNGEGGRAWGVNNSVQSFVSGDGAGLWLNSVYLTGLGHLEWFEPNCWGMGAAADATDAIRSEHDVFVKAYVSLPSATEWEQFGHGNPFPNHTSTMWTRTARRGNTSHLFYVGNGTLTTGTAGAVSSWSSIIRPTLFLKPNIVVVAGEGTEANPFYLDLEQNEGPEAYLQSTPDVPRSSVFAQRVKI